MAKFKISAPGRIVLSGEHIAIYGKQFLATSLNLRTTLEFCELLNVPKSNIRIEFPNINIEQDISMEEVELFCSRPDNADIISNPNDMFEYVQYMITVRKCMWTTNQQRFSLHVFLFLLYSIYYHEHLEIKPFRVRLFTEIPNTVGFGSSTSFTVCVAACFLHWQRLQSGCNHIEFNNAELESIIKYTVSCEKSMQKFTFPDVDAHVCTYGKIVKCQRIDYKIYNIEPMEMEEMDILLTDSDVNLDKYTQAEQIAMLNVQTPANFNSILNKLEFLTINMYSSLKSLSDAITSTSLHLESESSLPPNVNYWFKKVTSHIKDNQQLLKKYNLSAQKFDDICQIAEKYELAGKFTAEFTKRKFQIAKGNQHQL
ncbi:mevalonate kinase-like isoform X2 [Nylanderia fulva]|uniref:mevalonate kinase-like isoform X2 n=1 Tax=Nylanderia fulva TaxID=613905 RepID=UPI0010FB2DEF|nr:mevalonate kinase-like isoform X2 [Nylanderia fulva]